MSKHWTTSKIPGAVVALLVMIGGMSIAQCQSCDCDLQRTHATGTFRTTELTVDDTATINRMSYGPAISDGLLDFQVIYKDWNPTGLHTNGVVFVEAADNSGAVVTGMDSTGFKDGDTVTICNFNGHMDASSVGIPNLDSRSLANNRFFVPNGGKTDDPSGASTLWYKIGVDECADVMRATPIPGDATQHYWIFKNGRSRFQDITVGRLQLFPQMNTTAITGTVNNWNPTPAGPFTYTCNLNPGPGTAPCNLDGSPVNNQASTLVYVNTVDATGAILTGYNYTSGPGGDLGPVVCFANLGPGLVTFKDHGTSLALNQFNIKGDGSGDLVQRVGGIACFFHPNDSGFWYQIGHNDYVFDATFGQFKDGVIVTHGVDGFSLSIIGGTSVVQSAARINFADTSDIVMVDGHWIQNGTHPTAPGTQCGTGPTITGNDNAGSVTVGTGTTSCKLNFNRPMGNPPPCTWQVDSGLTGIAFNRTSTDITWTAAGSLAGQVFTWICPSPAT